MHYVKEKCVYPRTVSHDYELKIVIVTIRFYAEIPFSECTCI